MRAVPRRRSHTLYRRIAIVSEADLAEGVGKVAALDLAAEAGPRK